MSWNQSKMKVPIVLLAISALFIILDCWSIYGLISDTYMSIIKIVGFVPCAIIVVSCMTTNKTDSRVVLFSMYQIAYMLLICFLNPTNERWMLFTLFGPVFVFFVLYFTYDRERKLLLLIEDFILLVCIVSVAFYLFGTILNIIPITNYVNAIWGPIKSYNNYFYMYFSGQDTVFFNTLLKRNIGIFAEAPVYAYCYSWALFIELFVRPQPVRGTMGKGRVAVILLTAITSISVTGIVFTAFLCLMKYISKMGLDKNTKAIKWVILFPLMIVALFAGVAIISDKLGSVSGNIRNDDIKAYLSAWRSSPILGVGYNNIDSINILKSATGANFGWSSRTGSSSGLLEVLAQCGISCIYLYFMPVFWGIKAYILKRDYAKLAYSLSFFSLLFLLLPEYKLLSILMMALGWSERLSPGSDEMPFRNAIFYSGMR